MVSVSEVERSARREDATSARTLRVVHLLSPAQFGGLEQVVHSLGLVQIEAGFDVHVVSVVSPDVAQPPFVAALREAGATTHEFALPTRGYWRERRIVCDLIARIGPDIVHTHGYRPDLIHGWRRDRGCAWVSTLHGFCAVDRKGVMYERLQRSIVRRYDAVVAVSEHMAADLYGRGFSPSRLHCVANGYHPTTAFLTRPEARARLGIADDRFLAGFVGRLGAEKGPDLFVEAVTRTSPPADALVIGDGAMSEELRRQVAATGAPIRWAGAVAGAASLLRAFDVIVLSSRTEGTPMILLEAMAAEVPVVATRVGGVPAVVSDDDAILVDALDVDGISAGISAVRQDPDAARVRARRAHAGLEERFGAKNWLAGYERVYRDAITGQRERNQ